MEAKRRLFKKMIRLNPMVFFFLSYLTDLLTKIDHHFHGGHDQKRRINCLLGIFMLVEWKVSQRDMVVFYFVVVVMN